MFQKSVMRTGFSINLNTQLVSFESVRYNTLPEVTGSVRYPQFSEAPGGQGVFLNVSAPSLVVFKARLDGALSNPGLVGGVPAHGRGLELGGL